MEGNIAKQEIVLELLVKYVVLVILKEKTNNHQESLNENFRVGNAIVDVICKVNDEFITNNNLKKSNMKLIFDEIEFKKLFSNLKIEKQFQEDQLQIQ